MVCVFVFCVCLCLTAVFVRVPCMLVVCVFVLFLTVVFARAPCVLLVCVFVLCLTVVFVRAPRMSDVCVFVLCQRVLRCCWRCCSHVVDTTLRGCLSHLSCLRVSGYARRGVSLVPPVPPAFARTPKACRPDLSHLSRPCVRMRKTRRPAVSELRALLEEARLLTAAVPEEAELVEVLAMVGEWEVGGRLAGWLAGWGEKGRGKKVEGGMDGTWEVGGGGGDEGLGMGR